MALLFRTELGGGGGSDIQPYIVNFACDVAFNGQRLTMHYEGTPHAGEVVNDVSGTIRNGNLTLYPLHDGLWSVTATSQGGNVFTDTMTLEAWGTYSMSVTDMGYGAWLRSADIADTFGSLENVLADEKTVRELMTKHASADYLYNWYVADNTIFNTFLDSRLAVKWIGLRDYICDKFLANASAKTALLNNNNHWTVDGAEVYGWEYILKDKVPVMTANNAPYGNTISNSSNTGRPPHYAFNGDLTGIYTFSSNPNEIVYIGYKFTNPAYVEKVKINAYVGSIAAVRPYKVKLMASNDNSVWEELTEQTNISYTTDCEELFIEPTKNKGYYLYYKIQYLDYNCVDGSTGFCNLRELQFYGRSLNVSVPAMNTDNFTPYGEAFSINAYSKDYDAWLAFNGTNSGSNDRWTTLQNTNTGYIGYDFKKSTKIKKVAIRLRAYNESSLDVQVDSTAIIQTEIDGVWKSIKNINLPKATASDLVYFNVDEDFISDKWRIYFNSATTKDTNNNPYLIVTNLQFYGVDYTERDFEPVNPVKYIYDHGVEVTPMDSADKLGYTMDSAYNPLVSAVFNSESIYLDSKVTSGKSNASTIVTENPIDVSNYSVIRVITDGGVSNTSYGNDGKLCGWFGLRNKTSKKINESGSTIIGKSLYVPSDGLKINTQDLAVPHIQSGWDLKVSITEWWLE